jgi:hypothetical protein
MINLACLVGMSEGTHAEWSALQVPISNGNLIYATDTHVIKKGNGVDLWVNLPNFIDLFEINLALTALSQDTTFQSYVDAVLLDYVLSGPYIRAAGDRYYNEVALLEFPE